MMKLTKKKARELAIQEFGTAKGLEKIDRGRGYVMRIGKAKVAIEPDWRGKTRGIICEMSYGDYGKNGWQVFDFETLKPLSVPDYHEDYFRESHMLTDF